MQVLTPDRTLSELDHVRLSKLILRQKSGASAMARTLPIEQVLDTADIVPWREIAPNIVTMHSRILLKDLQTGAQSCLTLCYPQDAAPADGFVSVMSPLGWNLLGQKIGSTVAWPTPDGAEKAAEILAILFQPESSGDHTK